MTIYVLDTFDEDGDLSTHVGETGAEWTGEALSGLYTAPDLTLVELDAGLGAHLEGDYNSEVLVPSGKVLTNQDAYYELVFTMPAVGTDGLAGVELIETYTSGWLANILQFGAFMLDDQVLRIYAQRFSEPDTEWLSGNIDTGFGPGEYTLRLELTEARTRARLLLNGVEEYDSGTVDEIPLPTKMGLRLDADFETPTSTYLSRLEVGDASGAEATPDTEALPAIMVPSVAPVFLAEGHAIDEDSVYAQVDMKTGHSRARRVWTVTERVVTVMWLLPGPVMEVVDDWYENTLLAGELKFSARVRNQGPGMLWWAARWITYQTEMLPNGWGKVTGSVLLTGEGSSIPPSTGDLAMEIAVPLLSISESLFGENSLAMEISVALLQPLEMAMEIVVALENQRTAYILREDGVSYLLRENGGRFIRESA